MSMGQKDFCLSRIYFTASSQAEGSISILRIRLESVYIIIFT